LALLWRHRTRAVCGDLHHTRLSVPLLVLLYPGAVQVRREGARASRQRQQLPVLAAGEVIEQIDLLVQKYGVRNIKFADEMFVLHPRHVLGICDLLIERNYNLNIWAYARVDTVKDEMLDKLKRAGFNWLAFGIEAANEGVLNDVDKRYRVDQVYEAVEKVKSAGIHIIGNYIFGLPEDTAETMQQTLDLALNLNCEFANFLLRHGVPRLPALSAGAQQRMGIASDVERILAACDRYAPVADPSRVCRRRSPIPR
jgi:hypothetical protein